jgi:hypothetical protein
MSIFGLVFFGLVYLVLIVQTISAHRRLRALHARIEANIQKTIKETNGQ